MKQEFSDEAVTITDLAESARGCAHLLSRQAVGVHERGEVDTEDGNAAYRVAMQAGLLGQGAYAGRCSTAVQAAGDLVHVLRYQDALCEHQHDLPAPHNNPILTSST